MSMSLDEFIIETQAEVNSQINGGAAFAEMVFSDIVMKHMSENGMTFEPVVVCHYQGKLGKADLRLSGYALSNDTDQLDLFVSLYKGVNSHTLLSDTETKMAAEQCLKFLTLCTGGEIEKILDPSTDVYSLALNIRNIYEELEQVRIFVLTDCVAKAKHFNELQINKKTVHLEVMDIERLYQRCSAGKPRDELVMNFKTPLPCVFVPGNAGEIGEYDYALTALPGNALEFIYKKFGAQLLEANVRSFLSVKGKSVNAGIQNTLQNAPGYFMAYNNGIVLVADEMQLTESENGIKRLQGMQIVNGGQTTASLFFAKKKFPNIALDLVRVPAKIIVMKERDPIKQEALVSDISRFSNSQNTVRQSDLSANKPFHVDVERLSLSVYCPNKTGRWFYERAAGSYNTFLSTEGTTPVKLKNLKSTIPASRKITKTDLARYIVAWSGQPEVVSLGTQKNFVRFMSEMLPLSINVNDYMDMVAKTIIFKAIQKLMRPMFPAYQANVATYTVSVLSVKLAPNFDLAQVWEKQSVSPELLSQITIWAREVNDVLHQTANGRMISEWAKKPECRKAVFAATYSKAAAGIPEIL